MSEVPRLRLVGGPTALITYGGLRILTDPTFDPPGDYPRPGTDIVLYKLAGPSIPLAELLPIDLVLVSHDHHSDNLDRSGREMLSEARSVLTTGAGAERLGAGAVGMEPGDVFEADLPDGGRGSITAVLALHGPPEVAAKNGPVIGFVLRGEGLPTIYVSGDNASVDVVRQVVSEHSPIDVAVLFVGGAQVPLAWGDALLTLNAQTAVDAARELGDVPIVPIHQDGWGHFTSGAGDLSLAFENAGMDQRLRTVRPGEEVELG